MTINPSTPVNLVNVRGTRLSAGDTRDRYRQKLARITLDSMVQFVGLLDAKGTVLEINHVALDAVGIKLSDVEGKPFWTTFWWQVSDEINATLRDSIRRAAQGEFVRWDTEIYGRAGGKETIVIDASLMPVRDEQGNVVFITAEGRDITEKKAHEREIARQREELAKLDELKTQFFANISHEFRTPLTLMLGPIEDALADTKEPLRTRQRDRIMMVQRNSLRLQKLVNALLDFSRVEAGRIQAAYQPTDLAALTRDLASSFRSACERAGLDLTIDAPPLPEPVFVDQEMWEKIVLNLISNAFKFTLEGGIRISVSAEGDHAVLRVSDTGTGIPEVEVPLIFNRFHRVEGAHGRTHEGTGIGLALVQELVKLHKGSVAVESTLGRGTTFTVRIPFGSGHLPRAKIGGARNQASTATPADAFVSEALRWLPDGILADEIGTETEPVPAVPSAGKARARILIADDNADMRDYLCRLLGARYEVRSVADGEAALAALDDEPADLLLCDVMMPRLGGFGLLRALRSDPTLADLPVILLSARAGEEASVEGLESGANDYLVKPFSARDLLARIASNLEMARLRAHRRDAELALRELNEKLEQRVQERTQEVQKASDRLFESEQRFRLLVEGVVDYAILMLDPAGFVTSWNAGAERIKGYRAGEIIGQHFSCFYTEEDCRNGVPNKALQTAAQTGKFESEGWRVRKGGARFWASVLIDAIRDENGTLLGFAKVTRDMTEKRNIEEQLRQAQKMEAIGHLTGGVAHDFNNLLQVVLGNLDALRRRAGDFGTMPAAGDIRRFTENALRGAERAATLTQRLLAFSRRQPLDPRPTDVNKLVAGMSDLLRRTLGEGIAIETVGAAGLWRVSVDANQLESAVLNLAVNARDAMPTGGKLTIETANTSLDEAYAALYDEIAPGQYVMIAVSDTGAGMTKDVLSRAFDPFFTTKDIGQGTGLGLSQVYGFVKQSGGHVKIYSEPGQGTTVRLYLPRLRGKAEIDEHAGESRIPTSRTGEIILLVEDDADVRAATDEMLRELGYGVVTAADGAAALRLLATQPDIRLLFTDVGLPGGMNGRQLADAVRAVRPGLPVLFTTGYARNAIVHHGRLEPGIDLLVKPFTFAALAAKLGKILEDAQHSVGARPAAGTQAD